MSYEGYVQAACINGHYEEWDCLDETRKVCPDCGGRWAIRVDVDETNCEGWRFRQDIQETLETVKKQGFDNCLKDVVAWLRSGYKHDQAIADLLESGEWKNKKG